MLNFMLSNNYSERVRNILSSARSNADISGQSSVAPEHILLAMLEEPDGFSTGVLQNLDVNVDAVREEVERRIAGADAAEGPADILPYTSEARAVLERTAAHAQLVHSYVSTEHLLLGLLESDGTKTSEILKDHGLTAERVTSETMRFPSILVARAD